MVCPYCGANVPNGTQCCPECGERVEAKADLKNDSDFFSNYGKSNEMSDEVRAAVIGTQKAVWKRKIAPVSAISLIISIVATPFIAAIFASGEIGTLDFSIIAGAIFGALVGSVPSIIQIVGMMMAHRSAKNPALESVNPKGFALLKVSYIIQLVAVCLVGVAAFFILLSTFGVIMSLITTLLSVAVPAFFCFKSIEIFDEMKRNADLGMATPPAISKLVIALTHLMALVYGIIALAMLALVPIYGINIFTIAVLCVIFIYAGAAATSYFSLGVLYAEYRRCMEKAVATGIVQDKKATNAAAFKQAPVINYAGMQYRPEIPRLTAHICPKCGAQVAADSAFCMNCGAKIEHPAADVNFCPNCGNKLAPGSAFCPNCGKKL